MKSIGINTIHGCQNNYGGALQCFALYEHLRREGYAVEVIDLHRPVDPDYVDSIRFRRMRTRLTLTVFVRGWVKELTGIRRLRKPAPGPTLNPVARKRFDAFNARVRLSAPYRSIPALYKRPPHYDVYLAGSDQLWNPTQPYCLEPYFLTFVRNPKALKLSYGTSIGLSDITPREKALFRRWLASFDVISVREEQARRLLEAVTGRTVHRVPDPTFLLDPADWTGMAVPPAEEGYVLVFDLGHGEHLVQAAIRIAQATGRRVKVVNQAYALAPHPLVDVVPDAGPLEFIGLIHAAGLVLTNSFHCTVFSLITGVRNFYTYITPEPPGQSRGSRITDLLALYGLSDRVIHSTDELPTPGELASQAIDRAHTLRVMQQEQQRGRDFLRKAIAIEK